MPATRSAFLAACRRELGYVEQPTNKTKYAKMAGHANGQAWCATFIAAMAKNTGLALPSYSAYTPTMANGFKQQKRYGTKPVVGAIVFFYFPSKKRIAHVGVVEAVHSNGTITTIEGNSNAHGSRTGGKVVRQVRSLKNLTFGYPVYAAEPAPPAKKAPAKKAPAGKGPNPHPVPKLTKARPALQQGAKMTKAEVRYVQWAIGLPNTEKDIDGDWGPRTTRWVANFKKGQGLDPKNPKVGPSTLEKMKAVRR